MKNGWCGKSYWQSQVGVGTTFTITLPSKLSLAKAPVMAENFVIG